MILKVMHCVMCRYDLVNEPLTDPVVSWGAEGQRCVSPFESENVADF